MYYVVLFNNDGQAGMNDASVGEERRLSYQCLDTNCQTPQLLTNHMLIEDNTLFEVCEFVTARGCNNLYSTVAFCFLYIAVFLI
jgi:hypothetical protein